MPNSLQRLSYSPHKPQSPVDMWIGDHLAASAPLLASTNRRIALFADEAVETFAEPLRKKLSAELFLLEGGEVNKTRETKQKCEDLLLQKQFGRDTIILAMGGGVITDLIGFVAATYMRGVPLILIPTTLLAMVDAAIGGKTAVDTPFGKNLIGAFYHPASIWIDPALLTHLPQKEWLNGLAEILKYGLIETQALWQIAKERIDTWQSPPTLPHLIHASAETKIRVIQQDPEETGIRRILNFGHTVAHTIEQISHFQIPHGAAVAIGCQAECALSHRLGYLSSSELDQILALYARFGFPRTVSNIWNRHKFLEAMALDKKAKGTIPRFVLIDRIGHAIPFDGEYCRAVAPSDLEFLTAWLEVHHG